MTTYEEVKAAFRALPTERFIDEMEEELFEPENLGSDWTVAEWAELDRRIEDARDNPDDAMTMEDFKRRMEEEDDDVALAAVN